MNIRFFASVLGGVGLVETEAKRAMKWLSSLDTRFSANRLKNLHHPTRGRSSPLARSQFRGALWAMPALRRRLELSAIEPCRMYVVEQAGGQARLKQIP